MSKYFAKVLLFLQIRNTRVHSLRIVPKKGDFFTNCPTIFTQCKKTHPKMRFLGIQIVRVIELEFKIIRHSKAF